MEKEKLANVDLLPLLYSENKIEFSKVYLEDMKEINSLEQSDRFTYVVRINGEEVLKSSTILQLDEIYLTLISCLTF